MIKTVRIIGMGALGLMYGSYFQNYTDDISFLVDKERYQRYKTKTFHVNGEARSFKIVTPDVVEPVDLIIVATKANGLKQAIETLKSSVDGHTIIISLLNGVTSESLIAKQYGEDHIVYCVAQGMDAMKFGDDLQYVHLGHLCIGITDSGDPDKLNTLTSFFDACKLPYKKEEDIMHRLYSKWMLNVGINQTCMVFGCDYGQALAYGSMERLSFIAAMREAKLVAGYEGIKITEEDLEAYVQLIGTLDPNNMPSMAQDRINKKPSEIDLFAGTVLTLAKKHHIEVPVNEYLYEEVKKIEAGY